MIEANEWLRGVDGKTSRLDARLEAANQNNPELANIKCPPTNEAQASGVASYTIL